MEPEGSMSYTQHYLILLLASTDFMRLGRVATCATLIHEAVLSKLGNAGGCGRPFHRHHDILGDCIPQ